jgi:hypothetical protein
MNIRVSHAMSHVMNTIIIAEEITFVRTRTSV